MVLAAFLSLVVHAQPSLCTPQRGSGLLPNAPFQAALTQNLTSKARETSQCAENEGLAQVENNPQNVRLQSWAGTSTRLTPIDMAQARSIFERLKSDSRYSFRNPVDGCYARSHLVGAELQRQGIASGKVWLNEERGKRLKVERNGQLYEWEFHVANVIAVRKNGCIELMVLDPGVTDEPVTIDQWRAAQVKHAPRQAARLSITSRFDYEQGTSRTNWNCSQFAAAREANDQYLTTPEGSPVPPTTRGKGGVSLWPVLVGEQAWAADDGVNGNDMNTFEGVITRVEKTDDGIDVLIKGRAAYYRLKPENTRTLQRLRDAQAEGKTVRLTVRHASALVTDIKILP